jgi:DNA-binding NarL/FixJ family response regulator
MIRILLADDQALVRAGFRALIDSEADLQVVGEASDGAEAAALAASLGPDIVLMDIQMPVLDGIEATRRISSDLTLRGTRIVVLTTFETDEYVFDGIRAGASGFLVKDIEPAELLHAIRVVAAGDALLSPSVTRRLIFEFATVVPAPRRSARLDELTERELEVMALVATGLSNDEIAERLFVSPATSRTHVSRVMNKLQARDRAQVVVMAYELGLVKAGTDPNR